MFSRVTAVSLLLGLGVFTDVFLIGSSQFVDFAEEADLADFAAEPTRVFISLTILFNTFGKSDLLPRGDEAGIARFHTRVGQLRRNALDGALRNQKRRGVITLNAGSTIFPGKQFTAGQNMGRFFDAEAMEMVMYDAIGIGRRDFDFGPNLLADFIETGFSRVGLIPYVGTNFDFSGEVSLQSLVDSGVIVSSTVLWEEFGVPVGIVSAIDEDLGMSNTASGAVTATPIVESVQAEVDALIAAGAKIVVLMSQVGNVSGDVNLAALLTGVNVIISGGKGGRLLANPDDPLLPSDAALVPEGPFPIVTQDANGGTVLVASVLGNYGYVGELEIGLNFDFNMIEWSGGPRRIVDTTVGDDGVRPEAGSVKIEEKIELGIIAMETNPVGTTRVQLEGRQRFIRNMETNLGNVVTDAIFAAGTSKAARYGLPVPDVALYNGGGIRINDIIAEGASFASPETITEAVTFDILPFTPSLVIITEFHRRPFREVLENSVAALRPGGIGPTGTGRFLQIAGFSISVDVSFPAQEYDADGNEVVVGKRIREVALDDGTVIVTGGMLVKGDPINIITDRFLANGGDDFNFRDFPFFTLGVTAQAALVDFLGANTITARRYPEGGSGRITIV